MKKLQVFLPKSWTNFFARNVNFSPFKKSRYFRVKKGFFSIKNVAKHSFLSILTRKKR